ASERGRDGLVHFDRGQTIALQVIVPSFDQKLWGPSLGFVFYFLGPWRLLENALDLIGEFVEHVVIVSENLDRQLRFCALEHFVKAFLDRLRKNDVSLGTQSLHHGADLSIEFRFGARTAARFRPLV